MIFAAIVCAVSTLTASGILWAGMVSESAPVEILSVAFFVFFTHLAMDAYDVIWEQRYV